MLRHNINRLNLIAVSLHLFCQLADMEKIAAAEAELQMVLINVPAGNILYLTVIVGHPDLSTIRYSQSTFVILM